MPRSAPTSRPGSSAPHRCPVTPTSSWPPPPWRWVSTSGTCPPSCSVPCRPPSPPTCSGWAAQAAAAARRSPWPTCPAGAASSRSSTPRIGSSTGPSHRRRPTWGPRRSCAASSWPPSSTPSPARTTRPSPPAATAAAPQRPPWVPPARARSSPHCASGSSATAPYWCRPSPPPSRSARRRSTA